MRVNGDIVKQITNVPYNSPVISQNTSNLGNNSSQDDSNQLSFNHEGFQQSLFNSCVSLNNRQFDGLFLNPNFNLLSSNGTTPVTPAQGTNYEVVKKWFLTNGGGLNNYVITPMTYPMVGFSSTGSLYYLNLLINAQDSPLSLYNLNYNSAFDSIGQLSGQYVSFSTIIANNNNNSPALSFSTFISNYGNIPGGQIYLQPNTINLINTTTQIPDLTGTAYGSSPYAQMQLNIDDIDGGANFDIAYLKSELSDTASPLTVNPFIQQLICSL